MPADLARWIRREMKRSGASAGTIIASRVAHCADGNHFEERDGEPKRRLGAL